MDKQAEDMRKEKSLKDIAAIEEQCQVHISRIERLRVELAQSRHTNDEFQASQEDAEKLQAVLKELTKHRDNPKALFEFSQLSCEDNIIAWKGLVFSLATAQEEHEELQKRLEDALLADSSENFSLKSLEADLHEKTRQCEELHQQSEVRNAEKTRELQALEVVSSRSGAGLKQLAHEEMQKRFEEALLAVSSKDRSLKSLEADLREMTRQCEELQQQSEVRKAEKTRELQALEAESSRSDAGWKQLAHALDEGLRRRLTDAQSRYEEQAHELQSLKEASKENEVRYRTLAQELIEVRGQLDEARSRLYARENEMENLTSYLRQRMLLAQCRSEEAEEANRVLQKDMQTMRISCKVEIAQRQQELDTLIAAASSWSLDAESKILQLQSQNEYLGVCSTGGKLAVLESVQSAAALSS